MKKRKYITIIHAVILSWSILSEQVVT